jgi:hypothetical protein
MKTIEAKKLNHPHGFKWKGITIYPVSTVGSLAQNLRVQLLKKQGASLLAHRLQLFDIVTGSDVHNVIEILNSCEDFEIVPLAICWLDNKGFGSRLMRDIVEYNGR